MCKISLHQKISERKLIKTQLYIFKMNQFNGNDHFGPRKDTDNGFNSWFRHMEENDPNIEKITKSRFSYLVNKQTKKAIFMKIAAKDSQKPSSRHRAGKTRSSRRGEQHPLQTTVQEGHQAIQRFLTEFPDHSISMVLRNQQHCTSAFVRVENGQFKIVFFDTEPHKHFSRFDHLRSFFPANADRKIYSRSQFRAFHCDLYTWEEMRTYINTQNDFPFDKPNLVSHKLRGSSMPEPRYEK